MQSRHLFCCAVLLLFVFVVTQPVTLAASPIVMNEQEQGMPVNITATTPGLLQLGVEENLVVYIQGELDGCIVCAFNSSDVITNITSYDYNIVCLFPYETFQKPGKFYVWLQTCGTSKRISNEWPLLAFENPPEIVGMSTTTISATGGTNVTVEVTNPFDFSSLPSGTLSIFCITSASWYPWRGIQTEDPSKLICETSPVPIGPTHLTISWSYGLGSQSVLSPPYPITIRSNRILSLSPTSGCALGGGNVTLSMELPGASDSILCSFDVDPQESKGELADYPLKTSTQALQGDGGNNIICQPQPWSLQQPASAVLTLFDKYTQSPISNSMPFTYYDHCAIEASPNIVCSLGGVPVTLLGKDYPDLTSPYVSELFVQYWTQDNFRGEYLGFTVFTLQNTTAGYSTTPTRVHYYPSVYYQLSNPKFGNVSSLPLLEVRNTNSCLSSASPSTLSIDGGDVVTIIASRYTFGSCIGGGTDCYRCVFVDPSGYQVAQQVTVVSPFKATCISTPSSKAGSGTVAIALYFELDIITDPLTVTWSE